MNNLGWRRDERKKLWASKPEVGNAISQTLKWTVVQIKYSSNFTDSNGIIQDITHCFDSSNLYWSPNTLRYIQASLKIFIEANLYQNLQTKSLLLVALKMQTGISKDNSNNHKKKIKTFTSYKKNGKQWMLDSEFITYIFSFYYFLAFNFLSYYWFSWTAHLSISLVWKGLEFSSHHWSYAAIKQFTALVTTPFNTLSAKIFCCTEI